MRPVRWALKSPGGPLEAVLRHQRGIISIAKLGDGRLVSGSKDSFVQIWDSYAEVCDVVLEGHTGPVIAVSVLSDGRIVSGSGDNTVRIWKVATVSDFAQTSSSSTGQISSSSSNDAFSCERVLTGHVGNVHALAVYKGAVVFSGSADKTIRKWDANTGACSSVIKGHEDCVSCLAVLTGSQLVSGSWDTSLRLWNADTGECIRTLEGHTRVSIRFGLVFNSKLGVQRERQII